MGDFEEMCTLHAVIMLCFCCWQGLANCSMRIQDLYVGAFPIPRFIKNNSIRFFLGHPWPETIQTYSFELPRESILADCLLTVTFSDCVARTWWGFARYAAEGWTLDPDAVFAQMDFRQTWTAVRKIQLRLVGADDLLPCYWFQVFRQREGDGRDEILSASYLFEIRPTPKDALLNSKTILSRALAPRLVCLAQRQCLGTKAGRV
jgi:hypothetical protein